MASKEEAFVELLDATEAYMEAMKSLNAGIKQGLFHISQARYAYNGPLGQTQYPAEVEPCTLVHVTGACDEGAAAGDDAPQFTLATSLQLAPKASTTARPAPPAQPPHTSSQQGLATTAGSSSFKAQQPQLAQGAQEAEGAGGADGQLLHMRSWGSDHPPHSGTLDPLRWFGVLVPPALRSAQKDFLQAVQLCLQAATMKYKLQHAIQRATATGVTVVSRASSEASTVK